MSDSDAYDASRVVDLVEGETTRYVGADVGSGAFVMYRFEVACAPTDAEISFRRAARAGATEETNGATNGVDAAEILFVLRRGRVANPTVLGFDVEDAITYTMFPYEDAGNVDVRGVETGAWYLQLIVVTGRLRSGFEITHTLFGSRAAKYAEFNGCELDDGTLSVSVRGANETRTFREPFVAEPDYGACGNDTHSCYLGEKHSGFPDQGRGAERMGVGPIDARAVVAMSIPVGFDSDFFLLAGDARKFLGDYERGWFTTDGLLNASLTSDPSRLLSQMTVNRTEMPFDHEACGTLLNAADLRGAVCVTSRGGCFFSQKTLNCQNAGAVMTVIIDTEFEPLAAVNWIGSHPPSSLRIPTVVMNLIDGNKLLTRIYDEPEVNIRADVYECRPKVKCQTCAPGLTSPETNCTTARCPGMDELFSYNCSARGECRFDSNQIEFSCACEDGYSGIGCETTDAIQSDTSRHHVNKGTERAVIGVVCGIFSAVVLLLVLVQIRRRRMRGGLPAHFLWKPDDDEPSNVTNRAVASTSAA